MADPISAIGMVATVGGQIFQGVGAANQAAAQYEASQFNAKMARQNAALTRRQTVEEERRVRLYGAKDLGDIRSSYGASGVALEGSALDVLQESARNVERDALNVRHQGEMQAQIYDLEANAAISSGRAARTQGALSVAGTLLGGIGSLVGASNTMRRV